MYQSSLTQTGDSDGWRWSAEEAATAAERLLNTAIIEIDPVPGSVDNQDFLVVTAEDRSILKIGNRATLVAEAWACDLARGLEIPAPEVIARDLPRPTDRGMLIMRCLPGGPSPAPGHRALREAGRLLRRVHEIPVTGYGELRPVDFEDRLAGGHASWSDFTATAFSCSSELVENGIVDRSLAERVNDALVRFRAAAQYDGPPTLLHGDLHPRHLFADRDGLTGIIDWGDVSGGDPVFDLARYSRGGQETLPELLDGYGLELTEELELRFTVYRLIQVTRTLQFEYAAGGDWFEAYRQQLDADLTLLAERHPSSI